uniref:Chitinase n=1 Tax=Timema genevievae TaxID=629358 RepID=A0A7R9JYU5_TIMGE|nr:unnamed protein product [Timema genevievae]
MQPISSCLFLYFTLLCEAIYFPGDEVTKPPKRREKLPWYQHHRHTNKYPDDTVASVPTHLDRQGSVLSTNRPLSVDSNKPRSQGSWLDSPGNELEEETPLGLGGDAGGSGMETEDETMFSADVRTVPATLVKPTLCSSQDSVTSQLGPGECPPGATGQFTYPPDCGRFLNCWKGRGFVQPCAPATLFNPDTLECDFPAKVKCVESTIEEWQTFYTPSTHREGKHLPVSTTTTPPIVPKSDCPMEGGTGLASHPNDCSKYLNCWNGEAHIQSCGPGTLFNPVTLVCDYPYNVECGEHRELQEVSTNTDPEIILPTSSSTPTSTSTISTAPVTMQPHTHQSMSTSGQVLRLRGGSGPWEGYVEVQGSTPGWGLVCDQIHGWNILEANVVCKQLGYHRLSGAYKTVATDALCVALGIWPLDLEVRRRAALYWIRKGDMEKVANLTRAGITTGLQVRKYLEEEWQDVWERSQTGRRKHKIFPSVAERLGMEYLQPYPGLVHFITGHGPYKAALVARRLTDTGICDCGREATLKHVVLECIETLDDRMNLQIPLQANTYRVVCIALLCAISYAKSLDMPKFSTFHSRLEDIKSYFALKVGTSFSGDFDFENSVWPIQVPSPSIWLVFSSSHLSKGAEFSWQGRPTEDDTLKITVGAVTCSGNEATLAGCRLSHNVDTCLVARDAVGVRCYLNSASQCQTEEVNFDGKCYFLVNGEDGGFTHGEAIHHCQSQGGHLLDINSQEHLDVPKIDILPRVTCPLISWQYLSDISCSERGE